ncbi:MAG: response regulator [Pseudomonadales bacterium]|nr:response regulator [Pseudomonadales bacterium]
MTRETTTENMTKILIVEDEDIIRHSLAKLLTKHHYAVSDVRSINEALNNFRLSEFSLIISDLRLPGGLGSEFIKLAKNIPVIIMTSYANLRSAVDIMRSGAADYIPKPFDQSEILEAVKRALDKNKNKEQTHDIQQGTMSLESYFTQFVLENQDNMSETELAEKLGVSRKCLWERRQKLGIPRKKTSRKSSAG